MAKRPYIEPIAVEEAEIKWTNFKGEENANNREGSRNFCLVIRDPEIAQQIAADGWNIKHHDPREDGDPDEYDYLPVFIRFDIAPPEIYLIKDGVASNEPLKEESIGSLDGKKYKHIDLEVVPYFWEYPKGSPNAKRGIKAMLSTMYIEPEITDRFRNKWRRNTDLPFDTQ